MPADLLISVIVPTRNNARTIEACLSSVTAQTYPNVELIVVDNHSDDGTADLARRHTAKVVTAGPERSAQRNRGITEATGEWVVWLDSEMLLPPDALAIALDAALTTGAEGVALPERTIGAGFWTACRALERECYLDDPWLNNPRLLKREFMLSGGKFDLGMTGPEDADLRPAAWRLLLDTQVVYNSEKWGLALVGDGPDDEGRLTVAEVMRKRYYYGRSIPTFAAAHEGAVGAQGKAVLRAYARNRRRLLADPVHAVGLVALRGMEAVAYGVGARRGRRDRARGARSTPHELP